ncbi:hypothetical protein EIM22_16455 [Pseudomonas aeruginosa]|nr:hypothetical protein EIM22_16455 [Pseudomonas aeruginosa]
MRGQPGRQPGSGRVLWPEPFWRTRKVSVLHHKDSSMRHFALSRCRLACWSHAQKIVHKTRNR